MRTQFNRRHFLKGLAASVALPALPSFAQGKSAASSKGAARLVYLYVPNGVNLQQWRPEVTGADFALPSSLQPLAALKGDIQLIGGLDLDTARANGDGAGDHARANASFLTGCQAKKTSSLDLRVGTSVDQIAADQVGHLTRLSSLQLSTTPPRKTGSCDSGYSCAYQHNLSWNTPETPVPAERNPRRVFESLFGSGNPKQDALRRARHKSILDFVREDSKRSQARLGHQDSAVLDEYLESIRGVEQRIEQAEKFATEYPDAKVPEGIPATYQEHIRLMADLMVLAFRTDTTRIASFGFAFDGSNRAFPEIGVKTGHHGLSHHRGDEKMLQDIAKIDHFYITQLAYFLQGLKEAKEGEGSLLDQSMVLYGSGIGDGNRHNHDNLPIILAGGKGLGLQTGRHWRASKGTPLTNLHLALLEKVGAEARRVGDSTGVLRGI
mgnify:CR=1 FL=1